MKRTGGLWPQVMHFDNLCAAARRAARGKRRVAGAARFLADLEPNVLRLQRELEGGTWRPGRAFTFEIHDPKRRTISAAPFEDRVVHHALLDVLEAVLERRMVCNSFACRRGKGTHAALRCAVGLLRRHAWFLKLDVEHCFETLAHDVVLGTIARTIKDRRVLGLCERLVRTVPHARGLPIGNLSSQWFANLVLDRLDHFALEELHVPGYLRYMDDIVVFGGSKASLAQVHDRLDAFLLHVLDLRLKQRVTMLAPARAGLPFLGWSVHRGTLRLRPQNRKRTLRRLHQRIRQHRVGLFDEERLADSLRSINEHLRQGNTLSLRRGWYFRSEGEGPPAPRSA